MREWLARRWAHRKLSRGRCSHCRQPLRDDERGGFCSDVCADQFQESRAW